MPTFSQVSPTDRAPPRTVVLKPAAFADTWAGKPYDDVCVGLRLISTGEVESARAAAVEQAAQWHTNHETGRLHDYATADVASDDAFMRHCIARATCDCNDFTQPYFPFAENTVRDALTIEGVQRLWDELLILHVTSGVGIPRADDADIQRLAAMLMQPYALRSLTASDRLELRTLFGHALCLLVAAGANEAEDDATTPEG